MGQHLCWLTRKDAWFEGMEGGSSRVSGMPFCVKLTLSRDVKFSDHAAQSQVAWLRGSACLTTSTSKTRFGERWTAGWKSRLRSSNLSILAKDCPGDWRWQCNGAEWTLQFHGSYSGGASVAPVIQMLWKRTLWTSIHGWQEQPSGETDPQGQQQPQTQGNSSGVKERVLKMNALIDQHDDSELLPRSPMEVDKWYQTYKEIIGSQPDETEEPRQTNWRHFAKRSS